MGFGCKLTLSKKHYDILKDDNIKKHRSNTQHFVQDKNTGDYIMQKMYKELGKQTPRGLNYLKGCIDMSLYEGYFLIEFLRDFMPVGICELVKYIIIQHRDLADSQDISIENYQKKAEQYCPKTYSLQEYKEMQRKKKDKQRKLKDKAKRDAEKNAVKAQWAENSFQKIMRKKQQDREREAAEAQRKKAVEAE